MNRSRRSTHSGSIHRSIGLASLASLAALVAAACGGEAPAAQQSARIDVIPVRIAPVVTAPAAEPVVATGVLAGKDEAELSFKVGGVVTRVLVDEGDPVRAGQLLATLDPAEVDAFESKARSAVEQAERDVSRLRRLHADSVATLAQLEQAETGLAVARADLRAASFNRRRAVITAPASGVVLRRMAEPNEQVSPGTPVLAVRTGGAVVMRAGLADRDAVRVRTGARATVRLGAYPGETFAGRVSSVSAAASQGTGTWAVEVTLDPTPRSLGSGLVGSVELAPAGAAAMRLVPVQALAEADGDSATVFTIDDDGRTARRRSVRVAFVRDGRAALAAGLDGATHVVTDGVAYLRDGSLVKAAAATTETASAAKGAGRAP